MKSLIKPLGLNFGDTIALIRPASRLDEVAFRNTAKILRKMGFCVAFYPGKMRSDRFFAASDSDRARELSWAFREPGIRAVLACRGGYGSVRTLGHLKPNEIRQWKPKLFVGYSDMTYLHQWLQNQLGWVSIHGPLAGRMPSADVKTFIKDLMALPSVRVEQKWSEIKNISKRNMASGLLLGGNLSMIQVAGPAALPRVPMILAIEDVNEDFYRLDRMLRVLKDAGYSKYFRGILLGSLLKCGERDRKTFGMNRLQDTLRELTKGPIWTRVRFGHGIRRQRLLPLGCKVQLRGRTFSILEPVVQSTVARR